MSLARPLLALALIACRLPPPSPLSPPASPDVKRGVLPRAWPSPMPASAYFCGNGRKSPTNSQPSSAGCTNKATYPGHDNNQALERYEIRGWLLSFCSPWEKTGTVDNNEDECEMNLLPDVGWQGPLDPSVKGQLNGIDQLAGLLTPYNIISFGRRSTVHNPPSDPSSPSGQCWATGDSKTPPCWSELNKIHALWGGTSSAAIHIEMDGWGSERACNEGDLVNHLGPVERSCARGLPFYVDDYCRFLLFFSPSRFAQCAEQHVHDYCEKNQAMCYDYRAGKPPGWTFFSPSTHNALPIYWPVPLTKQVDGKYVGLFQAGDYVRIIGTLWLDGYHGPSNVIYPPKGYGDQGDAQSCWQGDDDYTNDGGHLEIHPVDFMELSSPDPNATPHTVGAYQICSKAGDLSTIDDQFTLSPKPPNQPAALPHVDERVRGEYTNWRSLRPSGDAVRYRSEPDGTVHVHVSAQDNPIPAKFMALYDSYWTCSGSCTGKCGGMDGCNNSCPPSACPGGRSCDANGSCACPTGTAACPPQGGACVAPASCCPSGQTLCPCRKCAADCSTACGHPSGCDPGQVKCRCGKCSDSADDCADLCCVGPRCRQ